MIICATRYIFDELRSRGVVNPVSALVKFLFLDSCCVWNAYDLFLIFYLNKRVALFQKCYQNQCFLMLYWNYSFQDDYDRQGSSKS